MRDQRYYIMLPHKIARDFFIDGSTCQDAIFKIYFIYMLTKPIVLVVDDEHDARATVIHFLRERYDCEFKEAKDGEEAVRFVKSGPCDIMLLDIKMPKKSGMAVLKEVKEINPSIDILMISAWASEEVAEDAMELGATDYATKPFDLMAISLKFSNILAKRNQLSPKRDPA